MLVTPAEKLMDETLSLSGQADGLSWMELQVGEIKIMVIISSPLATVARCPMTHPDSCIQLHLPCCIQLRGEWTELFIVLLRHWATSISKFFGGDCSFSFCNRPFKIHPHKVVPTYLHTLHSKMPDDSVKPRKGTKENPSGLLQGINGWVWGMRSLKQKMNHSNRRSLI